MDAQDWNERYQETGYVWTAEPNQFLVESVADLPPGSALDLAAGEGRNAVWLAQQGWHVDAVDFSQVGLEKARELAERSGTDEIGFEVHDLFTWAPPEQSYGLVVITYFQVPALGRRRVWGSAAAAVAPGGRLIVIGHDSDNLDRGYGGPQHPEFLYGTDEVIGAIDGLLDVERADQVTRVVENDEGRHEAIDNIVVAIRR